MATTFSLYDDLTFIPVPDKHFEATQLLKNLIKIVGDEIYGIQRNALHSYEIMKNTQSAYRQIVTLINNVESDSAEPATDENYWDDYDTYTMAIDPLEKLLLELSDVVGKEKLDNALPAEHSINEWEIIINNWKQNRESITTISKQFEDVPELKAVLTTADSSKTAQVHDDSSLVLSLCHDIQEHSLVDDNAFDGHGIRDTKARAATLPSKISANIAEATSALSVQSVMLIHAAMEVATKTTDAEAKEKLESPEVWTKAENLLSNLLKHLEDEATTTLDQVQKEWDAYLAYLKNLDVPLGDIPKEYYELRKTVRTVRRPYFSRTLTLVSHCRAATEHFKQNKTNKNLKSLVPAIKSVVAALKASADAIQNEITAAYNDDIETSVAGTAFITAETEIEKCFNAYSLQAQWPAKAKEMTDALALDKKRVEQSNAKFSKTPAPQKPTPGNQVKVTLNKAGGAPVIFDQVDENTRLIAVLWKVIGADSSLVPGSHFRKATVDGEVIGMDKTVKDATKGTECILHLVTSPVPAPASNPTTAIN